MKELFKVTRNNNIFTVAKTKCGHYYIALTLNDKRVMAWRRMSKKFINANFERKGVLA